jgi:putative hydrolase of the HAD superfamily
MTEVTLLVDADDTLWENNIYFIEVTERFLDEMESRGIDRETARAHLNDTERRNIPLHGYGSMAFAHSLGETFHALIPEHDGESAETLVALARAIHERDELEILPGVRDELAHLSEHARLILVTKGREAEQLRKIERSGLASYFSAIEIVPEKSSAAYRDIVERHELDPSRTWMVGNSPKSDINPALHAGLNAVLVPHPQTWELEIEDVEPEHERLIIADAFGDLIALFSAEPDNHRGSEL